MTTVYQGDACLASYPPNAWVVGGRRSGTYHKTTLSILGTGSELSLVLRRCTTVREIKELLANRVQVPPESLEFVVKRGCSHAKLRDPDEMPSRVTVSGIRAFERERQLYPHPFALIGAGHCGLRAALECVRQGVGDFVLFEQAASVGGLAWRVQANATSKLQTELGTYHLQFSDSFPIPKGLATYPSRDEMLKHFEEVSKDQGLWPHLRFRTRVCSVEPPVEAQGATAAAAARDPSGVYRLTLEKVDGVEESEETEAAFLASAAMMFPGNLTVPKRDDFLGEDVFGGPIGYGMFDEFDYSATAEQDVAVIGMGAFSVENVRTCLEHGARKCFMVCRRKNLVVPRAISWFINQSIHPPSASTFVHSLELAYALVGDDPWEHYAVTASRDRSTAKISQGSRFPVSDMYFLALYFGRAKVVLDTVKRLNWHTAVLHGGKKLKVGCVIKVLGFRGSPLVDDCLRIDSMLGFWPQGDCRRLCLSESPGVDFSRIGGLSLSPLTLFMSEVQLHLLHFPADFRFLAASGLPLQKRSAARENPVYVLSARDSMIATTAISLALPLVAERNFTDIKHRRQCECHPLPTFLAQLEDEWWEYCRLLAPDNVAMHPPYIYTVDDVTRMVQSTEAEAALVVSGRKAAS